MAFRELVIRIRQFVDGHGLEWTPSHLPIFRSVEGIRRLKIEKFWRAR